jgi:hypothetical protein
VAIALFVGFVEQIRLGRLLCASGRFILVPRSLVLVWVCCFGTLLGGAIHMLKDFGHSSSSSPSPPSPPPECPWPCSLPRDNRQTVFSNYPQLASRQETRTGSNNMV